MAFGIGDILTIGAGLAGFASGSKDRTISGPQIDPRLAQYYYGEDGKGGLLKDAADLYKQQIQTGGLNDLQRAGMNRIVDFYQSPTYMNGQNMMGSIGQGIMSKYADKFGGGGFTPFNPQANVRVPSVQAQTQTQPYTPPADSTVVQNLPYNPSVHSDSFGSGGKGYQANSNATPGQMPSINLEAIKGLFSGNSTPGGQGIDNDVANAALKALGLSENIGIKALSPTAAILARFLGGAIADRQTDAMGNAATKLSASQSLADQGINTVSDVNGNVHTYSTPESIAAADALAFGVGPSWDDAEATRASMLGRGPSAGGGSYGFSSGRNLGSMGGAQGIGGTANTGGYGFGGLGGLGFGRVGGLGFGGRGFGGDE